ncbi:MAG TPA: 2-oxoacid:acceptor oxidoreductase family protein [Gaiellaceae bacterium]
MKEVRWHARAGQGAKTVSQLLAEAGLLAGSSVQAFPEYGPERRGAPMRAYTRISDKTIRRHDPVAAPDIVIVLDPTLVNEMNVAEGLSKDGVVLVDTNELPEALKGVNARAVPATKIAHDHGLGFSNVVMLGAAAAAGGVPLENLQDAAVKKLGKRLNADALRGAIAEGYACLA